MPASSPAHVRDGGRRRRRVVVGLTAAVALALATAACGGGGDGDGGSGGIKVTSPAFAEGGAIPERFSCEGENVSPPLGWTGVPDDAVELAVVITDPEAPDGPFFHWLLLGVAPTKGQLAAGEVPAGAVQAKGSSENATYIGMCPPSGEEHRYRFTVHALRQPTAAEAATLAPDAVARLVTERSIASGSLTGRYAAS